MTAVRVTEPGIKTIKSPKLAEFLLFQAILALQYLPYRGCRIVMDQNRKNSPKERKSAKIRSRIDLKPYISRPEKIILEYSSSIR